MIENAQRVNMWNYNVCMRESVQERQFEEGRYSNL